MICRVSLFKHPGISHERGKEDRTVTWQMEHISSYLWHRHSVTVNKDMMATINLWNDRYYCVKNHSDSTKKFSETDFINMLEFFLLTTYSLCLVNSWHTYGCKLCSFSRRLVPLFLWGRLQGLLKKNEKELAWSFNFAFRYIDNVLSLNNYRFGDFVDHICPTELKIKDTTYTYRSHLEINNTGRLRTKFYDKRDDFNFPIVNFPFICSNIPTAPAYGVYISHLIRYSRSCGSYQNVIDRGLLLTMKLLN